MKKLKKTKLSLNKETISTIENETLSKVIGAGRKTARGCATLYKSCYSNCSK